MLLFIIFITSSSAQTDGEIEKGDNDPIVYSDEIISLSVETKDEEWVPLWKRYENKDSVDCRHVASCKIYKDNVMEEHNEIR